MRSHFWTTELQAINIDNRPMSICT